MATRHGPGQAGREDLAPLCVCAQPRRLDDGLAKEVAVLLRRLARREADSDGEGPYGPTVVALDALLHPDGAGEGPAQAGERHHQPVAEVLHLRAPRSAHGGTQQREVFLANLVGLCGGKRRKELGGAHEIRKEHRDGLGCSRHATPSFTEKLLRQLATCTCDAPYLSLENVWKTLGKRWANPWETNRDLFLDSEHLFV